MIRHIRINLITAALWLAWAIITPIDWLIDRTRQSTHHAARDGGERGGVGVRIHRKGQ